MYVPDAHGLTVSSRLDPAIATSACYPFLPLAAGSKRRPPARHGRRTSLYRLVFVLIAVEVLTLRLPFPMLRRFRVQTAPNYIARIANPCPNDAWSDVPRYW